MHLTQDTGLWPAFLNSVMNLQVLDNVGIY
jgi:hypothetical protein